MSKTLKAELWDNMHYLFRDYNDRMVHVELDYPCHLDIEKFKTVLICFLEKAPVLHSSFENNTLKTYWQVRDYHINDILEVHDTGDLVAQKDAFLMQEIDPKNHIQFKIALFVAEQKTTMCIVSNHMCMDGGDLKYFLYTLCENYSNYVNFGKSPLGLRTGDRSFETIYHDFNAEDEKKARRLFKNVCTKDAHMFPLTPSHENDQSFLVKREVEAKTVDALKAVGKKHGATLNDIFVAAFLDSLYTLLDAKADENISVACAMDLRKYYKESTDNDGLTNHTAYMQCATPAHFPNILETLSSVCGCTKAAKNEKFTGLYGLPILKLVYDCTPHALSEKIIKSGYRNPYISMSNIGILDTQKLSLCGVEPTDGFMTGAVKYKPYVLLSVSTMHGKCTFAMCLRGNQKDKETIEHFFDLYEESLSKFLEK